MRSPLTIRSCGFLGLLGGVLFIPYTLTKASISSAAVTNEWSTSVTTAADTALLVHLFETVPVLLLLVGLIGYMASHRNSITAFGRVGTSILLVGFIAVVLTHIGEHTLAASPVTGLPGEGNVFVYAYLLSWGVIESGEALLGFDVMNANGSVTPATAALAASLPIALAVGLTAVVTGTYTLAGTHRLVQAVVGIIIGRSLWSDHTDVTTADVTVRS